MKNLQSKSYYINRELSWLAFNQRVIAEAVERTTPLLERLRFMSIAASNLDEFFMIRVAGLKDQVKFGYHRPDNKTQMAPTQQLREMTRMIHADVDRMYRVLQRSIFPALRRQGITFAHPLQLTKRQSEYLENYYHNHIFPVLTPMAVDASHPFPMLSSKSLNLAVLLEAQEDPEEGEPLFAVVQSPSVLPRLVSIPSPRGKLTFVFLEDIIHTYMHTLFPGNSVQESACFRITRNADITVDEDRAEDLLEEIERELKKRKRGNAVRLEASHHMSQALLHTLTDWLELTSDDIYTIHGPLDLSFVNQLYRVPELGHLLYEPLIPQTPDNLMDPEELFGTIARQDVLLFHPYESFDPVLHFIDQAADDDDVLAIKQTLYRVSGQSPIVNALARAAENGKQVTVLVELKARFDEENNIVWAKKLEEAGCHVIYGVFGLKTHGKMTLVVRKEGTELRRYVHLSTGNYNDITARVYSDIGMFTAREDFGYDASEFFNHLTGFSTAPAWRQITTAPKGMKSRFIQLIRNEMVQSTPERPGRIIAKMNSLTDKDIIVALYEASARGVHIDLIVRGICCLRPGVPGVSENIRVFSIVGRFLEHSRIFFFHNGGSELVFLSSADWMTRNMVGRVEILFPVIQEDLKSRIKHILDTQLRDNVNRYELHSDRKYRKVPSRTEYAPLASQQFFFEEALTHHQGNDGSTFNLKEEAIFKDSEGNSFVMTQEDA